MTEFNEILKTVRHPARYLGTEVNAVRKDPRAVICRVALAYPDLYEVGMSYLGLHLLYDLVNQQEDLWAERVFAPDLDMEAALQVAETPLCSLESRTPLKLFDLVGFTLQHELNYPDILAMLRMGSIPLRADARSNADPLVIAGGPGASNPEPLAAALDAVFLGDAEEGLVEVARVVGRCRRRGTEREEILEQLSQLPGVYVPSRYRPVYDGDGALRAIIPSPGSPNTVRRRLLRDLEQFPPTSRVLVPCTRTIHDRLAVEIQRGCTRGCRFCQAGMINRPVRCRSSSSILQAVSQGLRCTGHEQVSFLSLSAGDHPQIIEILEGFFGRHAPERISASLPSLRAETLTPDLAALVRTVRKSGFTIAPEAGSVRLRRVIHKDLSDDDVLRAALDAFSAGWQLVKLYFMVGLPTETYEDRESIVALVEKIRRELQQAGFRPRINVGLSVFVPKAHTPFQWEAMFGREAARLARTQVQEGLRRVRAVKVGFSPVEMSWAEGLLARGDRRQFRALEFLTGQGQRLAAWSEHFRAGLFERAFAMQEIPEPDSYLRAREISVVLPWDHLDMGPSRAFLEAERERAFREERTVDCARESCYSCGACAEEGASPILVAPTSPRVPLLGFCSKAATTKRARLRFAKQGLSVHISHLDFISAIERACRRAGWRLAFSEGFHPKPKMSFGPACPVGIESRAEMADLTLVEPFDWPEMLGGLRAALPEGVILLEGELLAPDAPGLMRKARALLYRVHLGRYDPELAKAGAAALVAREIWLVNREVRGRSRSVDLRPSLRSIKVGVGPSGTEALLELAVASGSSPRPTEVSLAAFGMAHPEIIREALIFEPIENSGMNQTLEKEEA